MDESLLNDNDFMCRLIEKNPLIINKLDIFQKNIDYYFYKGF